MPIRSARGSGATTPTARIEGLERDVRRLRSEVGSVQSRARSDAGATSVLSWATLGLAILGVLLSLLALVKH